MRQLFQWELQYPLCAISDSEEALEILMEAIGLCRQIIQMTDGEVREQYQHALVELLMRLPGNTDPPGTAVSTVSAHQTMRFFYSAQKSGTCYVCTT